MRDRVTGRDIVQDIVENMRQSLEPLQYRALAPSRYDVVLYGEDFDRLEGILRAIKEDAVRALDEEVSAMNRGSLMRRVSAKVGRPALPVEGALGSWHIEITRDADDELKPGMTLVASSLELPGPVEYGSGNPTRRVTTIRYEGRTETSRETVAPSASSPIGQPLVYGTLAYEDNLGKHRYLITKGALRVGRGGISPEVDVQVQTSLLDISREHFRLRRDVQSGRFYLADLSRLGTTLNGTPLPRPGASGGADAGTAEMVVEGQKARIGLAGVLFMELALGN